MCLYETSLHSRKVVNDILVILISNIHALLGNSCIYGKLFVERYGKYGACKNAKQHLVLDEYVLSYQATYSNTSINLQMLTNVSKDVSTVLYSK